MNEKSNPPAMLGKIE